jgi:hypothetical protein
VNSLFLPPDTLVSSLIVDYELGGVALNDPSLGLRVKDWKATFDKSDGWVYLQGGNDAPIQLLQDFNITEVSLAFDQNMNVALAYLTLGVVKLYWFDTTIPGYTTTTFADARSPRVALDDKRPSLLGGSDVIFAYIRNGSLYYRQQRDRYTVEYFLRDSIPNTQRLRNIGMGRNLRFQFEIV